MSMPQRSNVESSSSILRGMHLGQEDVVHLVVEHDAASGKSPSLVIALVPVCPWTLPKALLCPRGPQGPFCVSGQRLLRGRDGKHDAHARLLAKAIEIRELSYLFSL
jgi:hypothetical protein